MVPAELDPEQMQTKLCRKLTGREAGLLKIARARSAFATLPGGRVAAKEGRKLVSCVIPTMDETMADQLN